MNKGGRKCLFNDILNTFHLRLYGVGHMVKNHSDNERRNSLPPYGLFFATGEGGGLFTFPYPLKVPACPPRDQRPALRSRVSGQDDEG